MVNEASGYFRTGLPYNRFGNGKRPLLAFPGLGPENRPVSGLTARFMLKPFRPLGGPYTVFVVNRQPGLPQGYSMADMARDYADVVKEEFGGEPIDIVGLSTGGSVALQFAADHPALVKRLVLYSAAYKLGDEGRRFQGRQAELAAAGRWGEASAESLAFMFLPRSGLMKRVTAPLTLPIRLMAPMFKPSATGLSDYVVTIEAEDDFDLRHRLAEIRAPTLVVGGAHDPFYTPSLFRETAAGIPSAQLALFEKAGHAPTGKQVAQCILAFLDKE